jgi:hypothetical protein
MAIRIAKPPRNSRAALHQGLADVIEAADWDNHAFMAVGHDQAPMVADPDRDGFPHVVFTVALKDIAGSRGINRARHIGWRYLHGDAGHILAPVSRASEVMRGGPGGGHTFHGTNEGPFVAQTLEMLQKAARIKKVRDGDFRPCLLRIPALYVVAVWLISEDGPEADVIIPMDPCHRALKPGRAYSREQLHKCLQKPARESLEYHSRPQPEP